MNQLPQEAAGASDSFGDVRDAAAGPVLAKYLGSEEMPQEGHHGSCEGKWGFLAEREGFATALASSELPTAANREEDLSESQAPADAPDCSRARGRRRALASPRTANLSILTNLP